VEQGTGIVAVAAKPSTKVGKLQGEVGSPRSETPEYPYLFGTVGKAFLQRSTVLEASRLGAPPATPWPPG
jgi:hypothetical protein